MIAKIWTFLAFGISFLGCTTESYFIDTKNESSTESTPDGSGSNSNDTRGLTLANPNFDLPAAQLWPGGKVYYRFNDSRLTSKQRNEIEIAMKSIQNGTQDCIKFIQDTKAKRTSGTILYKAYGENNEKTCESSSLGYEKDKLQTIVISPNQCEYVPGNYAGSAAHEIIHAIGFIHEFSRTDREKWFKFKPSVTNQNYVLRSDTFGIPMNYQSIMNYNYYDSVVETPNHPKAIGTPKNMGQECKISLGDLRMIEAAYYKECRADKKKKTFTKSYRIPGTDCGVRVPNLGEDFDMSKVRIETHPEN